MPSIVTEKGLNRKRNRPLKDYSGTRFGRLVAIGLWQRDYQWNNHLWLFRCDCGQEKPLGIKMVKCGKTTSCGCAFREMMIARNTTHGLSRTHLVEYTTWKEMRSRCGNPSDADYAAYGGRGIKVHPSWSDFVVFLRDMGTRPDGHSIDRIDVNGDYAPGNCRWALPMVQANNKRSNRCITIGDETRTLAQWCRHFGMDHSKVRYRLANGWSAEEAFSREDFRLERVNHSNTTGVPAFAGQSKV